MDKSGPNIAGYSTSQEIWNFLSDYSTSTLFPVCTPAHPEVSITIDNVTTTTFTVSFEPNSLCENYYIFAIDTNEIAFKEMLGGKPIHHLAQDWGINCVNDTTYTWTNMSPNTVYKVFAIPIDSTYSYQSELLTTLQLGGAGVATTNISVYNITNYSATTKIEANNQTAVFYYGLLEKTMFDQISLSAAFDSIYLYNNMYPQYIEDTWTWSGLDEDTYYVVVSRGKNALDEWGTIDTLTFKTLGESSLNKIEPLEIKITPNPATYFIDVESENLNQIMIYDELGKLVQSIYVKNDLSKRINVSSLKKGTYLLKAHTNRGVGVKKFVILE